MEPCESDVGLAFHALFIALGGIGIVICSIIANDPVYGICVCLMMESVAAWLAVRISKRNRATLQRCAKK